jgi:hypothetical protein
LNSIYGKRSIAMPVALTAGLGGFIAGRAGLAELTDDFVRRAV